MISVNTYRLICQFLTGKKSQVEDNQHSWQKPDKEDK